MKAVINRGWHPFHLSVAGIVRMAELEGKHVTVYEKVSADFDCKPVPYPEKLDNTLVGIDYLYMCGDNLEPEYNIDVHNEAEMHMFDIDHHPYIVFENERTNKYMIQAIEELKGKAIQNVCKVAIADVPDGSHGIYTLDTPGDGNEQTLYYSETPIEHTHGDKFYRGWKGNDDAEEY